MQFLIVNENGQGLNPAKVRDSVRSGSAGRYQYATVGRLSNRYIATRSFVS